MQSDKDSGWHGASWEHCQNPWVKKTAAIAGAILTHSMFLFSVGNNALAYGEATHLGFLCSVAGTAAIAATIAIEKWKDKEKGMPYRSLAGINFATAGLIGWENHLSGSGHWLGPIASASCLA